MSSSSLQPVPSNMNHQMYPGSAMPPSGQFYYLPTAPAGDMNGFVNLAPPTTQTPATTPNANFAPMLPPAVPGHYFGSQPYPATTTIESSQNSALSVANNGASGFMMPSPNTDPALAQLPQQSAYPTGMNPYQAYPAMINSGYIPPPGDMNMMGSMPPQGYPMAMTHPDNSGYSQPPTMQPQFYPMPVMMPTGPVPPCSYMPEVMPAPAMQPKTVEHFRFGSLQPSKGKLPPLNSVSKTNLYLSGLGENVTDAILYRLVEKVVTPKSCKALLTTDNKCNGIGFIDCYSDEDARVARSHIEELVAAFNHDPASANKMNENIDLQQVIREGRNLEVKFAHENAKDVCNVYVRNLPKENFTNEDLRELFSQYGHVISVKLLSSQFNGSQTGIGFVRMSTEADARHAIETVNQTHVQPPGSEGPLRCQLADKSDRRSLTSASQSSNPRHQAKRHSNHSEVGNVTHAMSQMLLTNSPTTSPTHSQSPKQKQHSTGSPSESGGENFSPPVSRFSTATRQ